MENQDSNNSKSTSTSVVVSFIIVALVVGLAVYGLMHKSPDMNEPVGDIRENVATTQTTPGTTNSSAVETTKPQAPAQKPMDTTRKLANFTPVAHTASLVKTDLVVGKGQEVKAGDTVSVQYTGAVAATGAVFQSSKDFGTDPVTFPLGGVIKGWTDGIPGMKVGGTRRLLIPAAQAYGATPPPGSGIPANADLVFDVELVGIK